MLVKVKALPERGFFRAGQFWPNAETVVDLDEETVAILEGEPMLQVRLLDVADLGVQEEPAAGEPEPEIDADGEPTGEPEQTAESDKPKGKGRK